MVKKVELQWPDPGELMKSWWKRWETSAGLKLRIWEKIVHAICLFFLSRIYDSPLSKFPRVSRFDVRSQQLEFSITDTQLPMFLRIVNLALALQNGDLERLKQVWPTMQFPSFFLAKKNSVQGQLWKNRVSYYYLVKNRVGDHTILNAGRQCWSRITNPQLRHGQGGRPRRGTSGWPGWDWWPRNHSRLGSRVLLVRLGMERGLKVWSIISLFPFQGHSSQHWLRVTSLG